jgi:type II secretory pathway pseudopilin PulG
MLPAVKRWGAWLVALALVATMLIVAGPRWFGSARARVELRRIRRLGGSSSDAAIVYRSMLNALGKRGFEKPAWFTPDEFARHLPAQERAAVARFTTVYNKVRFGGNAAGNAELIELLHKIEQ